MRRRKRGIERSRSACIREREGVLKKGFCPWPPTNQACKCSLSQLRWRGMFLLMWMLTGRKSCCGLGRKRRRGSRGDGGFHVWETTIALERGGRRRKRRRRERNKQLASYKTRFKTQEEERRGGKLEQLRGRREREKKLFVGGGGGGGGGFETCCCSNRHLIRSGEEHTNNVNIETPAKKWENKIIKMFYELAPRLVDPNSNVVFGRCNGNFLRHRQHAAQQHQQHKGKVMEGRRDGLRVQGRNSTITVDPRYQQVLLW